MRDLLRKLKTSGVFSAIASGIIGCGEQGVDNQELVEVARPISSQQVAYIELLSRNPARLEHSIEERRQSVAKVCGKLNIIFDEIEAIIRPGLTTREIDEKVADLLVEQGMKSTFLGYYQYPAYSITSINEEVNNTLPSDRVLKDGDVLSIQIGIGDQTAIGYACQAWTYPVGNVDPDVLRLLNAGKQALIDACSLIKNGVSVREVSRRMQGTAESDGFNVSRVYCGHAMTWSYRESPRIFCCENTEKDMDVMLSNGQILYVVATLHAGSHDTVYPDKRFGAFTADGKNSVMFGMMVVVKNDGFEPLTKLRSY